MVLIHHSLLIFSVKASDLFVQCLEAEGVEYIFGIPGEENLDLLESLRTSSIELILTRHEQSAVFMAATYGRFTGKPGVALATLGPGATNMVTGIGYAQLNGYPVIAITGQKPIKKSKQGDFQVIDVVAMMKPITKESIQIQNAARITTKLRHAFKLAASERPGVVHIELPEDIAEEQIDGYAPLAPHPIRRPVVEDKAIQQLIDKLERSRTPMILIGAGANRKRITKYLSAFIQKYNIPFFDSQMGKGVVDERLSQYIGTAALSDGDGVHRIAKHADLILAVGHDVIEKPTHFVSEGQTENVHINFYEAKVDDVYTPSLEVVGDVANLFWRLTEQETIDSSNWDFDRVYALTQIEKQTSRDNESKEKESTVMMPRRFVRELRELTDEQDIIALDNGWYKIWIARNYPAYFPNRVMLDNTFATMGAGLPTGIMAKKLNPENRVVVVTGDGGLVMNLGDLETAVRLGLDMTIVVIKNDAYGMIQVKQEHAGFASFGLDLTNPDFLQLAQAFGATGFRVDTPDMFTQVMQQAFATSGVTLVELPFVYS